MVSFPEANAGKGLVINPRLEWLTKDLGCPKTPKIGERVIFDPATSLVCKESPIIGNYGEFFGVKALIVSSIIHAFKVNGSITQVITITLNHAV